MMPTYPLAAIDRLADDLKAEDATAGDVAKRLAAILGNPDVDDFTGAAIPIWVRLADLATRLARVERSLYADGLDRELDRIATGGRTMTRTEGLPRDALDRALKAGDAVLVAYGDTLARGRILGPSPVRTLFVALTDHPTTVERHPEDLALVTMEA